MKPCTVIACAVVLAGQAAAAATPMASFSDRWIAPDEVLELQLSPELTAQRSRLRLFVGRQDVSALARASAPGRIELGGNLSWASGENEFVLYLVEATEWREVARWPLKVLSPAGFESSRFSPQLAGQLKGRADEGSSEAGPVSARGRHADASLRGGLAWTGQRSGWRFDAGAQLQAASFQGEALRFATLGTRAPQLDLAEYRVAVARDRLGLEAGHASFGQHPLLMNGLAARGLQLRSPTVAGFDLALASSSGSTIVGFDNLSGVEDHRHRIHSIGIGRALGPSWRVELSAIDASQEPRPDFGSGSVADAERSRGFGWRLRGQSEGGRLRLDAAWARSRHLHPQDPSLAQGAAIVEVQPATRDAHRIDLQAQLLQAASDRPGLAAVLLHERSAPLYRSLAAAVSGDQRHTRLTLQGQWRGANLQLGSAQREDNLARIATVLATRTDEHHVNAMLPLRQWLDKAWWPVMSGSWQRVHQFGTNQPALDASGFAATHRPDQIAEQQRVQLGWAFDGGSINASTSRSQIDNRQTGRETADFDSLAHELSLAGSLGEGLRAQLGLQRSRQLARENAQLRRQQGASFSIDWQVTPLWLIGGQASHQRSDTQRQLALQAQLLRRFEWTVAERKWPGQAFVRAAWQRNEPAEAAAIRQWWLDFGLSFNFQ